MRRLLAPALALLALAAAAPAEARHGPDWKGVQIHPVDIANPGATTRELDVARQARANVVRVEISWWVLEQGGKGRIDAPYLAALDRMVREAGERGIKVLPFVWSTPCWSSTAPESIKRGCTGEWWERSVERYPPADPADYGAITAFLANRYRGSLAAIEIWNEPDHRDEFYLRGPDKEARYAAFLKAAYTAVKAQDPDLPVLAGSLVDSDGDFLEGLYRQGIKGFYDGLAVHYYGLVLGSLRSIRQVQARNGDNTPLWLNEFGWTTCRGKTQAGHICVSTGLQARFLRDIFAALGGATNVKAAIVFQVRDDRSFDFGLVSSNFRAKPALRTVTSIFTAARAPKPRRILLRVRNGRAYGVAPAGDVVLLRAHYYDFGRKRFHPTASWTPVLQISSRGRYSWRLPRDLRRGRWLMLAIHPYTGKRTIVRFGRGPA